MTAPLSFNGFFWACPLGSSLYKIKPSDVGLEQEAQLVRGWTSSMHGRNGNNLQSLPPITYLHIHESESFTTETQFHEAVSQPWRGSGNRSALVGTCTFVSPGDWATLFKKQVQGERSCWFYLESGVRYSHGPSQRIWRSWPEGRLRKSSTLLLGRVKLKEAAGFTKRVACVIGYSHGPTRPAKLDKKGEMRAPSEPTVLYPTSGGNIHSFRALTPCAIFDILSPPYSAEDGRDCTYFRRSPREDLPGTLELDGVTFTEVTWLEEFQPPDDFVVRRGQYKGRAIKT
ncbi:hypothetical protein RHMOL_Rhmol06G0183600 [Rhododendron molle]|uniref:Uncharacterized protein n=1 Tax=Rhododendron molle TaxID=49168 RepID=A0ACC0NFZ5_RHOML|nr:hypothetical protein RHMOL_Rhmol06G0183600 [Rhododendron molle]